MFTLSNKNVYSIQCLLSGRRSSVTWGLVKHDMVHRHKRHLAVAKHLRLSYEVRVGFMVVQLPVFEGHSAQLENFDQAAVVVDDQVMCFPVVIFKPHVNRLCKVVLGILNFEYRSLKLLKSSGEDMRERRGQNSRTTTRRT